MLLLLSWWRRRGHVTKRLFGDVWKRGKLYIGFVELLSLTTLRLRGSLKGRQVIWPLCAAKAANRSFLCEAQQ